MPLFVPTEFRSRRNLDLGSGRFGSRKAKETDAWAQSLRTDQLDLASGLGPPLQLIDHWGPAQGAHALALELLEPLGTVLRDLQGSIGAQVSRVPFQGCCGVTVYFPAPRKEQLQLIGRLVLRPSSTFAQPRTVYFATCTLRPLSRSRSRSRSRTGHGNPITSHDIFPLTFGFFFSCIVFCTPLLRSVWPSGFARPRVWMETVCRLNVYLSQPP